MKGIPLKSVNLRFNYFALAVITDFKEKALLLHVAEGNEKAFGQLYRLWQPALGAYVFRVTKSRELAAEIIQDVFLKIWMNRETLSEINNFKSYLFVMSRNQALNALRKVMQDVKLGEDLEMANKNRSEDETLEHPYLSMLDEAIDNLSPRQKEIYLLHKHERLTYVEIAEKLGIGMESVKTHLQLAIKAITKFLKDKIIIVLLLTEKLF